MGHARRVRLSDSGKLPLMLLSRGKCAELRGVKDLRNEESVCVEPMPMSPATHNNRAIPVGRCQEQAITGR